MNSTLWKTNEEALGHFILGGTSLFVHAYAIFICYAISDYQGLSIYYVITRKITTFAYPLTVLYFHLLSNVYIMSIRPVVEYLFTFLFLAGSKRRVNPFESFVMKSPNIF